MTPNRTARVLAGLLVAAFAFGLVGCQGESRPRPPKAAKNSEKPAPPAAETAPVPPAPPETPDGPIVIVAGPNGDGRPVRNLPALMKKVEDKIALEKITAERFAAKGAPAPPTVRLLGIRSKEPHRTKELALADALTVARIELMKQLEQLDPPIHTRPSMVTMRSQYLKGEPREIPPSEEEKSVIRANNLNPNVRWVEIDLELSEDHVQKLRSAERVTDAFRIAALAFALVAALYGFLRLDQWTKGYLTLWLGLGAGVLVVVVGLMVFS
jgi:hypothetical protein